MNTWEQLPKPFFVLAPMDDVTDVVFRRVNASLAPADLYFTEFVNVDGLMSPGRSKLLRKLKFDSTETALIAQIWGLQPKNFEAVARQIADGTIAKELGLPEGYNFVGVDLNMGCPAKSEVKSGACSALIMNRPLALEIIDATKRGLDDKLPISVKTRVGYNEVDMSWIEFLLDQELDMLTIHGRTKKEMSKVPANWDLIGQAASMRKQKKCNTLIVGNGDVETYAQGEALAAMYDLDGIMIGRGVFTDPFVFSKNSPFSVYTKEQKTMLYRAHVEAFAQTWQPGERNIKTLNKFCKVYIQGFDGAKELREKLMNAQSTDELLNLL